MKPELETLEGMQDAVKAAFKASGVTPRKVQLEYALHVAKAIHAGRTAHDRPARDGRPTLVGGQALIEAETGVGKTLGYLIPLFLEAVRLKGKARVLVSTYTVALQRQIVREGGDLEVALRGVAAVTGSRPNYAIRIGMRHFIDPERLEDHLATLPHADPVPAAALLKWAAGTTTGQIAEYTESGGVLPDKFEMDEACVTASSTKEGAAFYEAQVARAHAADFVVTNHATVLYDTLLRGTLLGNDPPIAAAVFDECDRLPQAAESVACGMAPLRPIIRLIEDAAAAVGKMAGESAEVVRKPVDAAMRRLIDSVEAFSPIAARDDADGVADDEAVLFIDDPAVPTALRKALSGSCRGLARAAQPWAKLAGRRAGRAAVPRALEEFITRVAEIERFGANLDGVAEESRKVNGRVSAVGWSPRMSFPRLHWMRLFPAWLLGNRWVDHDDAPAALRAAVFTSATIATFSNGGTASFMDTEIDLGLALDNPCRPLFRQFAPATFGKVDHFWYADPGAPSVMIHASGEDADESDDDEGTHGVSINPAWVDYAADMLVRAQRSGGRTLVIPSSFRLGQALAVAIAARGARNVVVKQRGASPRDYDSAILSHDDSIFIAAGLWEGYELRQGTTNAFRNVFIPKVPFAPPGTVKEHAIARRMARQGKSFRTIQRIAFQHIEREAQRRLRQGFGRGIRHPDDAMVFWIADPKYPTPLTLTSGRATGGSRHSTLRYAIPKRFRDGVESTPAEDDAGVFRYVPPAQKKSAKPARKSA